MNLSPLSDLNPFDPLSMYRVHLSLMSAQLYGVAQVLQLQADSFLPYQGA